MRQPRADMRSHRADVRRARAALFVSFIERFVKSNAHSFCSAENLVKHVERYIPQIRAPGPVVQWVRT